MALREAEKQVQEYWMTLTVSERLSICAGMYEGEKAILEQLAPKEFARRDVQEFVFYHMHGKTIGESINFVPENIP